MAKYNLTQADLNAIRKIFESLVAKLGQSKNSTPSSEDNGSIANAVVAMRVIKEGLAGIAGGLDEVTDKFKETLDSSESGKFVDNLRDAFKSSEKDAVAFEKMLSAIQIAFQGNEKAIAGFMDDFEKLSKMTNTFNKETLQTTDTFSTLASLQTDMMQTMKKQNIAGRTGIEILQNQIRGSNELQDMMEYAYADQEKLNGLLEDMHHIMENPSDKIFNVMGNAFSFKDAIANFHKFRDEIARSIDAESSRFDSLASDISKELIRTTKNLTLDETQKKVVYASENTDKSGKLQVEGAVSGKSVSKYNALLDQTKADISMISAQMNSLNGLSDEQYKTYVKQYGEQVLIAATMLSEVSRKKESLALDLYKLNQTEKLVAISKQYHAGLERVDSLIEQSAESLDELIGELPAGLVKFAGLDKITASLTSNLENAHSKFIEIYSSTQSGFKAWKGFMGEMTSGVTKFLNPFTLGVAAFGALLEVAHSYESAVKDIASAQGISVKQADKMYKSNLDNLQVSENQISTMESMLSIQNELQNTTGQLIDTSTKGAAELVTSLDNIGFAFGIGGDRAAEMHRAFTTMGADDKLGAALTGDIELMAEAANISTKMVSDDVVNNAADLALYFGGLPNKAKNAVVQIQKMGFQFEKAGQLIQRTWNIEGFLTDMYELQSMSGIDLSKTFESGLTGDAEGVIKNTLDAIGSIDKFNQMSIYSQKKLSDTTGLGVDELRKALMLKKQGLKLTAKDQELFDRLKFTSGEMSEMSKEEIENRISSVGLSDKLAASWDKIKFSLMKAVLPLAEKLAHGLEKLLPILEGMGSLISGFLTPISGFVTGIAKVVGYATDFVKQLFHGSSEANHMESGFFSMGETLSQVGKTMGGIFLATKGIKLAVKMFPSIFKGVAESASKMDLGGKLTSTVTTKAKDMVSKIPGVGSVTDALIGKAKEKATDVATSVPEKLMEKAKEKATDAVSSTVTQKKQKDLTSGTLDTKGVTEKVSNMGSGIFTVLNNIGKGIGSLLTNISSGLMTSLGDIGKGIGNLLKNISSGLMSVIGNLGKGIGSAFSSILTGLAKGTASLANPAALIGLGALTLAIIGIGAGIRIAAPGIESLGNLITKLGGAISTVVTAIGDSVIGILGSLNNQLKTLLSADPSQVLLLGGALTGLAVGVAALGVAMAGGTALSGISSIFGGGVLETLTELTKMASPLESVSNSILNLGKALKTVSDGLASLNIDELKKLNGIDLSKLSAPKKSSSTSSTPQPPPAESVAQHVKINSAQVNASANSSGNSSTVDSYMANRSQSNQKMESLLQQLLVEFKAFSNRPNEVVIDTTNLKKINSYMKALNNNR